jgi:hypothetical protein
MTNTPPRLTTRAADSWTRGDLPEYNQSERLPAWAALVRPAAADADRWAASSNHRVARKAGLQTLPPFIG